jgi:hypothetical protein
MTASLGENGFVYHPSGFMRGGGPPSSRPPAGEGPEKTDTDAQKQAAVSHHFFFVRRIERPSLVALLRTALGERWS